MALYGNITVDEMAARALITVREMNACKKCRLPDMNAVCEYYQTHHTFLHLSGIGERANQNLTQLCSNMISGLKNEIKTSDTFTDRWLPITDMHPVINLYKQLSDVQKTEAQAVYGELICSLQRRSIRALFMLYKSKNLAGLVKGLAVKPTAFAELAGTLMPTGDDLNLFLQTLTCSLSELKKGMEETGNLRFLMQNINSALHHRDKRIEMFLSVYADKLNSGDFPVSDFIDVVINCNQTLPATYKKLIFISNLFYKKEAPLSIENLSSQLGIQPSRIKQLLHHEVYRLILFKEWEAAISTLQACGLVTPKPFQLADVPYYYFEHFMPVHDTPFTNLVLASLFSFLNPHFRLFSIEKNETTMAFFSHKKIEAWFDIVAFFNYVDKQISKRIVHDFCIRLSDFLLRWCQRAPSEKEHKELHQFVLTVLNAKYYLITNTDGSIILYRTAKLTRREYIIDFLRTQNCPCSADDILAHVQSTGSLMTINSLITYLQSLKNTVQPLGNNMYGLQEWNEAK